MDLRERALAGFPEAMVALADAGEDLSFLPPEQRAYGWCQTFHPRLAEGMEPCRDSERYRVLSSLKLGLPVELSRSQIVEVLEATGCQDPDVAKRAREILSQELSAELVERLCDYALSSACSKPAREVWVELGHVPVEPHRCQIYLIRMNLPDRAEELDPRGDHLAVGARELRPAWRLALAAILRERGRGHLVPRMLGIARESIELDGAMLAELLRQGQHEALWTLAPFLSTERAREVILGLGQAGFAAGAKFEQARQLAMSPVDEPAVFSARGLWLGWGGRRIVMNEGDSVVALEWPSGQIAWRVESRRERAILSPDGRWAALKGPRQYQLYGPTGRKVPRCAGPEFRFSSCSRFCTTFGDGLWSLDPPRQLQELWLDDWLGSLGVRVKGRAVTLADPEGERRNVTAPWPEDTPAVRLLAAGPRWLAELRDGQYLLVEPDGASRKLPGRVEVLDDGRLLGGLSAMVERTPSATRVVWDGKLLRSLPHLEGKWSVLGADRLGSRLVANNAASVGLVRLGDTRPYRIFPGSFRGLHPTDPYLATFNDGQIHIWHIPAEVPLGPDLLRSEAADLPPRLRPLALHLLRHRFEHEVSLEEHLPLSPAHDIQLS